MSGTAPVAVVTGSASGIGAATVRRLVRDGFTVVGCDVDDEAGAAIAEQHGTTFRHLDVGDASAWRDLADQLARDRAPLTRAVLNAGTLTSVEPLPFLDVTVERYQRVRAVNLDGVVVGLHTLAPLMADRGGGAIVATASLAGLGPYAEDPIYAATKHAVVGLVRSVAPQLAAAGVRVHAICPGGVDTGLLPADRKAEIVAAGRPMLAPDEVADAVAALLEHDGHGLVHTIVHGRGSEQYVFRGVPGPRD